ncbi:MAG: 3-dehydroquinate synthase [Aestuariivirgaceae bacterium]|nr:3-dehydroquinate synthase [Aestuariivirgaceae bacterium]
MTNTVRVELGNRAYDISIGPGLLGQAGERLKPLFKRPRTVIVTDENVAALHLETLKASLSHAGITSQAIILPPGEGTKNFTQLAQVCDGLLAAGMERADRVIAFGGGVIGDLTGFAASILRRGIDFIQIPTTLLAQVDSSVGGKTGINSVHGKNLIGAFHQPVAVLADTALLNTLSAREFAAGYAETAKYGLLGDAPFFNWLEANAAKISARDTATLIEAVSVSCRAKAKIVAEDETETGVRALLNLGHTFGHAFEAACGYSQRLLHGEAVSIGMVMAFRYSQTLGLCTGQDATRVQAHLVGMGLPVKPSQIPGELPGADALLTLMRQDKKAHLGKLTFILARGIGEAFIARDVEDAHVLEFVHKELQRG